MRVYDSKGRLTVDFKLHASKHESGGTDEVSLAASQITSGRFGVARMPDAAGGLLKAAGTGVNPSYTQAVDAESELTISAGAVTASIPTGIRQYRIDTEADAATDDLDTINGGVFGNIVLLKAANVARTVVVKHNTGNIKLNGGADFSLDGAYHWIMLSFDANSTWVEVARSSGVTANADGDLLLRGINRATMANMPDGTSGQVLTAQGSGSDPAYAALPAASGLAIFGNGSDGDITVNADPFTSGTLIVNNVLKRDAFFNNLIINATRKLETNGYRIFVKGTLTNNGTIRRNGNNGNNGADGGAGGLALASGSLGGSGAGGAGKNQPGNAGAGGGGSGGGIVLICAKTVINNGTISTNGGNGGSANWNAPVGYGTTGGSVTTSKGANGGKGGDCGDQSGGSGGTATAPTAAQGDFLATPQAILFHTLDGIRVTGGAGGGGGAARDSVAIGGGGGGGGGGGCVVLIYNSITLGTVTVSGSSGGAGYGSGQAGAAGSVGTIVQIANA